MILTRLNRLIRSSIAGLDPQPSAGTPDDTPASLVSIANNPVPSGAVCGAFASYDGVMLRFARWSATRGPNRGTVCVFPGRGEFIEKYFEVIAELRRRGFAVAILDWRGQGGSQRLHDDPRRGHATSFAAYDRDLTRFMKAQVLPDCPPPYMALGHSMGAHILLRHAIQQGSWFERLVLSAPFIAVAPQRYPMPPAFARAFCEVGCRAGLSGYYVPRTRREPIETWPFEGNWLTSDLGRYQRNAGILAAAPGLGLGAPTLGWTRAALRSCAMLQARDYPEQIKVPALILSASDDEVVSVSAIEDFAAGLKVGTHVSMPGSRHEILQETDAVRRRFWAVFDAYLGVDQAAA